MDEIQKNDIQKAGEEILKARTGEEIQPESPLDEARRLNRENKELIGKLGGEINRLERMHANIVLSGRTEAGQSPEKKLTPVEEARARADDVVNDWFSKRNIR